MLTFARRCPVCHRPSTLELEPERVRRWLHGEHVQDVWPERTPDERELIVTGTHPACWDRLFPDDGLSADDTIC